jgi:intracellular sulfur oxidation DsrE/DsrF family protein
MSIDNDPASRRDFLGGAGRIASAVALAGCAPSAVANAATPGSPAGDGSPVPGGDWDLSWIDILRSATDRAVFDWPSVGDPADPIVLELAERYLDNCQSAYAPGSYKARAVLNIRTQAIGAAMTDELWERYALGTEYNVKDPSTQQLATRNPFWYRAPSPAPGITLPSIADLMARGVIVLVCDFAMGHLSNRLATKMGRKADEVHAEIKAHLIKGAYAVPSGIFGLARAQSAGCAYIRM